ncbi:hypothetical protein EPO04_03100 [Patescibacteria group bacterium]|nr:MAG: hypothetical protein EPO04_03100 [Patescibacteria group bacterium]
MRIRVTTHAPPTVTDVGSEKWLCNTSQDLSVGPALEHERAATNIALDAGYVAGDGGGTAGRTSTGSRGAPEVVPLT